MNAADNKAHRAGHYLRQPTGYRAFIPAPLPPKPPLDLDGHLRESLSEADYALGRLDGAVLALPNPDLFVFMYVPKEAVLSSQIEGTQSSLQNLLAAEAQLFDPDTPKDVSEAANYVRAMNHGLARLAELPVSVRLIREIHAELMRGVRGGRLQPGELRTSQNWIGPAGCTLATATFVPPPPHEVPRVLGDLERFLHHGDGLPALVQVGLAHAQFETIHPFLDGNGRVGRLLITFLLTQKSSPSRCSICRTTSSSAAPNTTNACKPQEHLFSSSAISWTTSRRGRSAGRGLRLGRRRVCAGTFSGFSSSSCSCSNASASLKR